MNQPETNHQETRGWKDAFFLLVLSVLGVTLRAFFARQLTIVSPDGALYGIIARKFLEQGWWESLHVYWSPLYPTVTGVFGLFIEDLEQAGRAVSVFFGGALIIPVYLLARRFYGRNVAIGAAILVTAYPFLIERSTKMATESLYTFLFVSMLLSGWLSLEQGRVRYYASTGAFLGFLYLTRTEAYAFVLLFLLFGVMLAIWKRNRQTFATVALGESVLVICFLIVSSPYLFFIHDQTERWSPGLRGIGFVLSPGEKDELIRRLHRLSPDGKDSFDNQIIAEGRVKGSRFLGESVPRKIATAWILRKIAENLYKVYHTYQPTLVPGLVVVFLAMGLFSMPWERGRLLQESYLAVIVGCTLFGYSLAFGITDRYFTSLIPIVLVWASGGVVFFGFWFRDTLHQALGLNLWRTRAWGSAMAVCLVLLSFAPKYVKFASSEKLPQRAEEHKEAGLWIRENMGKGLKIMSSRPYAAFYAEGAHLYIPDEAYSNIIKYASRKGVDVLVVDEEWTPSETPQLEFLLENRDTPKPLVAVYKNTVDERDIVLYKLGRLAGWNGER